MNVICYKRVSTDEQADRGFSLLHQETMLIKYCEINNYNIIDIYTEDCSGKSFDRPKWKEKMSYIKKNMGKVRTGAWKKEPSQDVMGLHPALVSEDIFYRANDVLNGRKRNMKFHDDKSDLYPLKGLLVCPDHKCSLTAYACRSHTGKLHHYYFNSPLHGTSPTHPQD
jgi:hypothetical protein